MNDSYSLLPDFDPEDDPSSKIANDRRALESVRQSLVDAGYYAYGTLDDQNRWSIAVDDEMGRVDVRIGDDGYDVVLWTSSPGLYADEESPWRQQSRARLARMMLPNIARGYLEAHQVASWDEVDQGVAIQEQYQLPFNRAADIGQFVREHLPRLEAVLTMIERQLG
ncbi:MAG TPA: hypothetical protein VGR08_10980 [Thermomicrobiales bacterium]|nr:hypothetical protein [Thermomicrobiales bacterium]